MLTAVFYGTSLTALQPWTADIQAKETDWLVLNEAESAKASDWGLANFQNRVLAFHPDKAVIEFATNDAYTPYGITLAEAAKNTWAMVTEAKVTGADVYLMTMNGATGAQASLRPDLEIYNALYRAIAESLHVGLIDTAPAWSGYVAPDGIHPTLAADQAILVPAVLHSLDPFSF